MRRKVIKLKSINALCDVLKTHFTHLLLGKDKNRFKLKIEDKYACPNRKTFALLTMSFSFFSGCILPEKKVSKQQYLHLFAKNKAKKTYIKYIEISKALMIVCLK